MRNVNAIMSIVWSLLALGWMIKFVFADETNYDYFIIALLSLVLSHVWDVKGEKYEGSS